jgi:membrane glycosyltransferase
MNATAPAIARTPMRARPWFGPWRGLLLAVWPGLSWAAVEAGAAAPAWVGAARRRRRVLLALLLALAVGAAALGHAAGMSAGVPLALVTLLLTWVGIGLITATMGAWVIWRGDPHAPAAPPPGSAIRRDARTAIVMPICNEDIATVFGGLRATCQSLAATGALSLFDVYILSDTSDPRLRAAELAAWRALRDSLGDGPDAPGGRIFYRVRRRRSERKAGNVSDFCRRWGRHYRYMVVLDADSTMQGDTLVELVRRMEANPRAGILQTLPQAVGHDTVHARAQQFGTRVTGRLFARGMAYWQLGDSHYWGHNAILRVAPFMAHCRMAHLPGRGGLSGAILSHDFVEAAMMRRAGYEVWVLPELEGSWEQTPPNLLDELQRDRRWCQGNLQNARLIAEPGWQPAHRAMFLTGAMSYLSAPLWLALLASGWLWSARAAWGDGIDGAGPAGWAGVALWALTLTVLLLPRLLGVATVLLERGQAAHGGTRRLLTGSLAEAALAALQAPVRMVAHSAFVIGALTGLRLEWRSPPRDAQDVAWADAMARIGLLALPVAALVLALAPAARDGGLAWLPIVLPLLLAVPMVVLTGSARLGAALRRRGLLAVAEELRPPHTLTMARHAADFAALAPRPASAAAVAPLGPVVPVGPARARGPAWPAAARAFAVAWGRLARAAVEAGRGTGAASAVVAGRGAGVVATAALLSLVLLGLPRTALGPEAGTPARHSMRPSLSAQTQRALDAALARPVVAPSRATTRVAVRRAVPERPARFIDDAVRERALRAVGSSLSVTDPAA